MSSPLARDLVIQIIEAVGGRGVLIGGQAVAWWAEYYARQNRLPEVDSPEAMFVSKDADFAPNSLAHQVFRPLVEDVAQSVKGIQNHKFAWNSIIAASVTFRDGEEQERSIEFLRRVHGVDYLKQVVADAISFEAADGLPGIAVMHPVMLLETRVANVLDLDKYRDDEGILQAKVAVGVAREWHLDRLGEGWAVARKGIERTLTLAERARGLRAATEFGIPILDAVPTRHPSLPAAFVEKRLPACREKVAAATASVA